MSIASLVKELRERTGAGMMDCKKALTETDGNMEKAIEWLRENGIAKAAKKGDRVAAEGLTKVVFNDTDAVILELNAETDFVSKNKEFLELLDATSNAILNSSANTLEEALAVEINGETIETLITNTTATIGEKISLRRIGRMTKSGAESFVSYSHMGGRISVLLKLQKEDDQLGKSLAMHTASEKPEYLTKEEVDEEHLTKEREILLKEVLNEGKPEKIAGNIVEGKIRKYLEQICLLEQSYVMDSDKKVSEVVANEGNEIIQFFRYEVGEGIEKQETNFAEEVAAQAKI